MNIIKRTISFSIISFMIASIIAIIPAKAAPTLISHPKAVYDYNLGGGGISRITVDFDLMNSINLSKGDSDIILSFFNEANSSNILVTKNKIWSGYLNYFEQKIPRENDPHAIPSKKKLAIDEDTISGANFSNDEKSSSGRISMASGDVFGVIITVLRADGSGEKATVYTDHRTPVTQSIIAPTPTPTAPTPNPTTLIDKTTGVTILSDVIKSGGKDYHPHELNMTVKHIPPTETQKTKLLGASVIQKINEATKSNNVYTDLDLIATVNVDLYAGSNKLTTFEHGLKIKVPYDQAKYGTKNLYVVHERDGQPPEVLPATAMGDGTAEFMVYHLSSYTLAQGVVDNSNIANPKTGDINMIIVSAIIILGLAAVTLLIARANKRYEKANF